MSASPVDPSLAGPEPGCCPVCGKPVRAGPTGQCPLCGHSVEAPSREFVDQTPYGQSDAFGARAFGATCSWVCGASAQRLTHLALLPRSPASRRFMFWMVMLLVSAAALVGFSLIGWHTVTNAPTDASSPAPTPTGRGWYHLAEADPPLPYRSRAVPTDVWWNPVQSILATVSSFVVGLLVAWIVFASQRRGAQRALGPKYRDQGRLEAGLHYNAAWLTLLLPAAALAAWGPLSDISAAKRLPIVIPRVAIYAPAVVLAIISVCGYGFGLIRLAGTVPVAVRTRVVAFFAFWNPLLTALWVAGAGVGLYFALRLLVGQLGLNWSPT